VGGPDLPIASSGGAPRGEKGEVEMRKRKGVKRVAGAWLLALLACGTVALAARRPAAKPPNQAGPAVGPTAQAAKPEPGPVQRERVDLSARPIVRPGDELSGDEPPPAAAPQKEATVVRATGGSCITAAGAVLQCPSSGGPRCGAGKSAVCRCFEMTNGTWMALSGCAKPDPGR
jgi:hypothetical protein